MDVTLENPFLGAEGVRLDSLVLISQAKGQSSVPTTIWAFFVLHIQSQAIAAWFDFFVYSQSTLRQVPRFFRRLLFQLMEECYCGVVFSFGQQY